MNFSYLPHRRSGLRDRLRRRLLRPVDADLERVREWDLERRFDFTSPLSDGSADGVPRPGKFVLIKKNFNYRQTDRYLKYK